MEFISVSEFAARHGVSERTTRSWCANGKIEGAVLCGSTWSIPADASVPQRTRRKKESSLLKILREQKESKLKGGIYHRTQIDLTYNSNHIEGSRITHEQTRYIFETNTIGITDGSINVDDIVETTNHFRCIDLIIDNAVKPLNEPFIKLLHFTLKAGTSDSRKDWFRVGDYKKFPNEVGGIETCPPEDVHRKVKALLKEYNSIGKKSIEDIIRFHWDFECIHPFQDGNGRVGRLIMFKECLASGIVPFIITDDLKLFYYRGLREYGKIDGYLTDTILTAQDRYKTILDYFKIRY